MLKAMQMDPKDLAAAFTFLDNLRESGKINMFGAAPYLADAFDLERREAIAISAAWMETFDREASADDRAAKALEAAK